MNHPTVKIAVGYGRLYVTGPDKIRVKGLPGCVYNHRRGWYELSLTMITLNRIRRALGVDKPTLKSMCADSVTRWVAAAGASNALVKEIHAKLETGWRRDLPWDDSENEFAPMAHQEIMASVATTLDGTAFTGQMGTCKTRPAAEAAQYMLANGLDIILVVCPKGVIPTWRKQLKRWTPNLPYRLLADMPMAKRRLAFKNAPKDTSPGALEPSGDIRHKLAAMQMECQKHRAAGTPAKRKKSAK